MDTNVMYILIRKDRHGLAFTCLFNYKYFILQTVTETIYFAVE